MLIATCRDDDVQNRPLPLLLGRAEAVGGMVRRIEVGGLRAEDVLAMVTESLGTAPATP